MVDKPDLGKEHEHEIVESMRQKMEYYADRAWHFFLHIFFKITLLERFIVVIDESLWEGKPYCLIMVYVLASLLSLQVCTSGVYQTSNSS